MTGLEGIILTSEILSLRKNVWLEKGYVVLIIASLTEMLY